MTFHSNLKYGDKREDGYIYVGKRYGRKGNKPDWRSPEAFKRKVAYSKKNKINLLKKLASIENKLIQECFEEGFYTKTTGKSSCWWMWTTTDENHTKTKLWKERNWQF